MKVKDDAIHLDALDYKILEILHADSRQRYTEIGKRLGVAHSTVYDRIKKMEKHDVIKKYTTIVNADKIGNKNVTALMTVYTEPKESEKVAEKLCQSPQVLEVYSSLSEELQIIAKVIAENQESLHEFIAYYVAPLPGVLRIRTAIITKKFKENQFSMVNDSMKVNIYKKRI